MPHARHLLYRDKSESFGLESARRCAHSLRSAIGRHPVFTHFVALAALRKLNDSFKQRIPQNAGDAS
jgi:hypothetical protein